MIDKLSRRELLSKSAGTAVGAGFVPTVSAHNGHTKRKDGRETEQSVMDFKVTGEKITSIEFSPDTIIINTEKRSPDLKKRFGITPPKLTETETIDRTKLEEDPFPKEGMSQTTNQWETEIATQNEWEGVLKKEKETESGGMSTQGHSNGSHRCSRAEWNFEVVWDGDEAVGFDRKSPINVILGGVDVKHIGQVLKNKGWTDLESWGGNEHSRYVYDSDRDIWVGPDNEPLGAYAGFGSKGGRGILGRCHVRAYELEAGVVSLQAHKDDWRHNVATYEGGKSRIVDIFTNLDDNDPIPAMTQMGTVDSGSEGYWDDLDSQHQHNGKAAVLQYIDSDNAPDPIDITCPEDDFD